MNVLRNLMLALAGAAALAASPASAQFFFKSRDVSGAPVTGNEPGVTVPLPGATPAEQTAGLVWTLRAALNVAALQCQFEPTLLTVSNYNAMLNDHKMELQDALDTLGKYYTRTLGKKDGQTQLDQFNTHVYSEYSTVSAQYMFCQTASAIGRDALYAPPGGLAEVARTRLRELHNSLVPWGEQMFPGNVAVGEIRFPNLDDRCWTRDDEWNVKKCGTDIDAPTAYAQR